MAKLPPKEKSKLDRIRDVSETYCALLEKQASLISRHDTVLAEIAGGKGSSGTHHVTRDGITTSPEIVPLAEQGRRSQIGWVAQTPKPKPKPVVRHPGAVALVGDLLPEQPIEEISPPPPRPSWPGEDRLRVLGEESEAITEALKLLASPLAQARKDYSKLVAAQRGGEYQSIVETIVDAARALGDALLAQHRFIDENRRNGVAYGAFRPLDLSRFENLDAPSSPLLKLITDAVEAKHVVAGKSAAWSMPVPLQYLQGGN